MKMKQLTMAAAVAALILNGCSDNGTSNTPPVVQIDAEQNVKAGQPLQLNANASDADGTVVSYVWKEGEVLLATTAAFSYTPDTPGEHRLTVTVTDDKGAVRTRTVTIMAGEPNQLPTANAGEDREMTLGETLTLSGSGSDADGNVTSYLWKEGATELSRTPSLDYTPASDGMHTLTFSVTDNDGVTVSDDVRVNVLLPNQPPVADAGEGGRVAVGEGILLSGSGSDSDGTIVSYEWKEGESVLSTEASFTYQPATAGMHTLTLTVTDDDGVSASDTLQIEAFIPNQPPVANAGADRSVEVNHGVTLGGSGSDSDGSIVSYEWKEGSSVLANTAVFTYVPASLGAHTLTLTVTDNDGASHSDIVVITARTPAQATTPSKPKPQNGGKPVVVEKKAKQWYIRLVAEDPARNMKTATTQLGELEEENAVEKHTLKSLTPFGGSYLDVVFKDPAGVEKGEYKVNFHKHQDGAEDRWRFTVKTDENNVNADILLSWRGVYVLKPYTDPQNRQRYREYRSVTNPIIRHMKLVDVESGEEIPAAVEGKVQTYTFNMNGAQTRTFEWVVQEEEVKLPVKQSKISTLQAKALKRDAKVLYKEAKGAKADSFDLGKPPMIKEDMPH